MFEVITAFTDLQDSNYKYAAGDKYPREGYTPSAERIAELSGSENRRKLPLIKALEVQAETGSDDEPKPKRASRKPNIQEVNEEE